MAHRRETEFPDTGTALACHIELGRGRMLVQAFTEHSDRDLDQLIISAAILDANL